MRGVVVTHFAKKHANGGLGSRIRAGLKSPCGNAAIEFALVAPVLSMIIFATAEFGVFLVNYIQLTNAAAAGARRLAASRPATTPYTSANSAVTSAAPGLNPSNITVTVSVAGTACTTDATCKTSLGNNIGAAATVRAAYPCSLPIIGWTSGCTITSQSSQAVQ